MERVTFSGLPDCIRLSNDVIDVVAATAVGPRILRCGFLNQANLLGEFTGLETRTALGVWKPWGGHRLWAAPEEMPGSYAPDNDPVECDVRPDRIALRKHADATGLEKRVTVHLAASGPRLTVEHELWNRVAWPVEIAPWALTVMAPGGCAVLPQPVFHSHDEALRPVRAIALWPFTNLADPRWMIGRRLLTLTPDRDRRDPQKIGIRNERGWCACVWPHATLMKRFALSAHATYPDFDVNNEVYAEGEYLEIETLGPLVRLEPGEHTRLVEDWAVFPGLDAALSNESRLADALEQLAESSVF
jgi:hypothetical protein